MAAQVVAVAPYPELYTIDFEPGVHTVHVTIFELCIILAKSHSQVLK